MSLLVRAQDSVNILITGIGSVYRTFDLEQVLKEAGEMLEAHLNPIALPDVEKLPVLGSPGMFERAWAEGHQRAEAGQKCLPLVWHGGPKAVCRLLYPGSRPVFPELL